MSGVYKWSAIDRVCNSVMTFAGNVILARILTPYDFGLLAMVAIFVAIAYNISGCGLSDGLIKKTNPTDRDYSTVFVFNLAFGLFFCTIFISLSQPVANYFGYEELRNIMWAVGICFVFSSMTFTQETKMRKELDMKRLAVVRLSATASSLILGIYLALAGYGFWALVSTRIFLSVFLFIFYVLISRWIPKLAFYKDSFREMFGYGVHLMLSYVFTQIGRNINSFVLGKYSPVASGVFSQAQKLQEVPYGVIEAVYNWPFFAVLSNEQNELKRRELAQDMFQNILWIGVVAGALLILLSSPGIRLLYGEKWVEAIPIFRILIIYGIFTSMKYFFQTILKVSGETRIIRNLTLVEIVLQLVLLVIAFNFGIYWITISQVVTLGLILLYYLNLYIKIEEVSIAQVLLSVIKTIMVPLFVFVLVLFGYSFWNGIVHDVVNVVLVMCLFGILFVLFNELIRPSVYMSYRNKIKRQYKNNE